MKLVHPWVHQCARRTNSRCLVAHEIFIRDTCFIIRIDPLSSSPPPRRRGIDLPLGRRGKSHKDELKAGNELVLMSSKFPSSVLSQFYGYSSASEPRGLSDSLSVTADRRRDNNVRVPTNCDGCCRDEGSCFVLLIFFFLQFLSTTQAFYRTFSFIRLFRFDTFPLGLWENLLTS